jgi:diaminopimelate epimerase
MGRVTVGTLTLRKLHGAGNDFLVLVDPGAEWTLGADLARALCDRRSGIGADGVLHALPPQDGGDVRMELRNADGSPAETSGNGLRCFVLAAIDAGLVGSREVRVETAAGLRQVEVRSLTPEGGDIAVDMGPVVLGDELRDVPEPGWLGRFASVGNPHLVLLAPSLDGVSIASLGPKLEQSQPGGLNVEVIAAPPAAPDGAGGDRIDLVVWERGAGVTLACGSGSCAAAAVARDWGLCGDAVTVRNPGGDLLVELSRGGASPVHAVLSGPTTRVATMVVTLEGVDLGRHATQPATAAT